MADKKTKQAEEVKTVEELRTALGEKQNDLMEAKTGLTAGELANPMAIRKLRREVARLNTEIRARELAQEEK